MKRHVSFPVLALTAAVVLAGCTNSPVSRIDRDRAVYDSWPLEVKEAVLNGEARKGMTREQVEMAMGRPTEIVTRAGNDEVWVYRKGGGLGSKVLSGTGVSVGGGVGGVGVGTGVGGLGSRQTPEEIEVVFADGVVIRGTR